MHRLAVLALPLSLAPGCLPSDTRPPPAEVLVTASSSELTQDGILASADGYQITFARVLASIGQARVADDEQAGTTQCSEYSNPYYTRLFDFTQVSAREKLGLAYALGSCPFGFGLRFPNLETYLETGATEADREFMRTPASDKYAEDSGVSLHVEGSAVRGQVTKHFAWDVRARIGYSMCWVPVGDAKKSRLELSTEQQTSTNIEIQAEALFMDPKDPEHEIRFQPFADADADEDDEVTLEELDRVKVAPPPPPNPMPDADDADDKKPSEPAPQCLDDEGNPVAIRTLRDYFYCTLVPRVARFESTGWCDDAYIGRPR